VKAVIGVLAYVSAAALTILTVFRDVPLVLSVVGTVLLVLGALASWSDKPTDPCRCVNYKAPKTASGADPAAESRT